MSISTALRELRRKLRAVEMAEVLNLPNGSERSDVLFWMKTVLGINRIRRMKTTVDGERLDSLMVNTCKIR